MVADRILQKSASDCGQALALLDEEFIFSRGRTIPLSVRFASALSEPASRFLVAQQHHRVESLLFLRPFQWITPGLSYRAAMIGLVWTRPEARGRGYGGALLAEAAKTMAREGIDFAVLWATRPEFYLRAGWIPADCGVLGRSRGTGSGAAAVGDASTLWPAIHSLRESTGGERVVRQLSSYTALLPPATRHEALLEHDAYALIGRNASTAYVQEIGGAPSGLPFLWHVLQSRYGEVFINLRRGSPAHLWLGRQPSIAWQNQSLAMWLPLSARADPAQFGTWYIPFLDRV